MLVEDKRNVEKLQYGRGSVEQIVDSMTLFDDDLMSMVFDENIPATELLLKTILKRDDIEVVSVVGQKELENPIVGGRNIRLDILARDWNGKYYNVEVQRSNDGADERRARFHSSMVDSRMLNAGQKFKELRDSYVVFITQKDYFGYGLPIYTINRHLEEMRVRFEDGSHIIYMNGSYRGDDSLGRLMQDFACKDPEDMYYSELADGVRHFKEEGGRELMCQAVEEYAARVAAEAAAKATAEATEAVTKATAEAAEAVTKATAEAAEAVAKAMAEAEAAVEAAAIKATIEDAISYGMEKEQIIARVCDKYGLSREEADKLYYSYAAMTE